MSLGHHRDGFEPPFGGTTFPSNSLARRWIANSVSSSAMRPPRRRELRLLAAGQTGRLAAVDSVLPPPPVDRLRTDVEIARDVRHRAP